MHSRSLSRATITADSLRRDPPLPPLRLVQPVVAFGVVAGTLTVTRAFEINWPFTGQSQSFQAGASVELLCPEQWEGGDIMVIVATPLFSDTQLLVALPKRLQDPGDLVLGGFDLDSSGAVLAGSLWDANLESVAPPADPVVTQMADYFVERRRDGFDDTTHIDLVRHGFAEADILRHHGAATTLAAEQLRDTDIAEARTSYDRQARVMQGAAALAGELDPNRVHTTLRHAGLSTREIGDLFDDIIGESMRLVREGNAALTATAGVH